MEFIIEFLIELILEGSFELSKTKKTPKWLRYPLIIFVILFFIGIISIILLTGYLALSENILLGTIIIIIGLLFLIVSIYKFKHIYVKRNPLSEESKLWNKFIEQICTKKIKDLNDIQKNAVFCFYYDSEVNSGGHVCYFDNYRKVKNEELIKALEIVANKKYVKIFKEAVKNGKTDNYQKTDEDFFKQTPYLTEYLEEYVINNKEEIFK